MPHTLRIAHLSDLHYFHFTLDPRQFFSKSWMGNWNFILFRKKAYQTGHLKHIPEVVEGLKVDASILTGDFSSTSLEEEFVEAKQLISTFSMPTFVLPGNHDCYTKDAEIKKKFYTFFPSNTLSEKRVEKFKLKNNWSLIVLDCALATPPFFSKGLFFPHMEEELENILKEIPLSENVIVANHFPLFTTGRPHHDLGRAASLQNILKKYPQVKVYLHGHDHKPYIIDKTQEGYPLVLNAGSCAHRPNGTFFVLDLFDDECLAQQLFFQKDNDSFSWVIKWQKHYSFVPPSKKYF